MGRTSQIIENPAVKTLKWKNEKTETEGKGANKKTTTIRNTGWYYYDKNLDNGEGNDKGGEVEVGMNLTFLWLESATSFTGYNKANKKGIYSNEVLNTKTQKMTVRMGEDTIAEGLYNDVKDKVKGLGGKFCAAVYALADLGNGNEIVRILMAGSARNPWFDIAKKRDDLRKKYVIAYDSNVVKMPTGDTYEEPVFKFGTASTEDLSEADNAYTEKVEPYFELAIAQKNAAKSEVPAVAGDDEEDEDYDDNN